MKLTASLICRNEGSRYLGPCLEHLLEFCDRLVILDDSSTDGWRDTFAPLLAEHSQRITVATAETDRDGKPDFHRHAEARNLLLKATLATEPGAVLAIDCDEMVSDGAALRKAVDTGSHVVSLEIAECWEACPELLCIRQDGGWRSHQIGCVWRADRFGGQALALADKGHATGRVPEAVHRVKALASGASLIHFGWSNVAERAVRFARYDVGDGGRFHQRSHIDSILLPDDQIAMEAREWPAAWSPEFRARILERANRA